MPVVLPDTTQEEIEKLEGEEKEEMRRDLSDVIDRDQAAVLKSAVGELDLENYEDILGGNKKPQGKIS